MDVSLVKVSKRYGKKTVLRALSLEFRAGAVHAIVGGNGAGKSTLASIIAGSVEADSGFITCDRRMVCFRTVADAMRMGIVCVNQQPPLADWLTVRQNILVSSARCKRQRRNSSHDHTIEEICAAWCPALPLEQKASELTGGKRFYASLVAALMNAPKVLILDEGTALLSEAESTALYAALHKEADGGMNVIVITHHRDEVQKYCDTVYEIGDKEEEKHYGSASARGVHFVTAEDAAIAAVEGAVLRNADMWRRAGAAIIPTDRTHTGADPRLTVAQLLCATRRGAVDDGYAARLIATAGVDTTSGALVSSLSGGMLQRLTLARELYGEDGMGKAVVLAFNPLHGLNDAACRAALDALQDAASRGGVVLSMSNREM